MSDRPEIMMPVTPAGAVEQMLLEELRRLRESNDKVLDSYGEIKTQLALIIADGKRSAEDRSTDRAELAKHDTRIGKLETWRAKQETAHGIAGWFFNSPLLGWLAAAAAGAWAILQGKGHP